MKIYLSRRAERNFSSILDYLQQNWSEKVRQAFIEKTIEIFGLLENFPEIGSVDMPEKQIRGFQITKQIRLIYRIKENQIVVLSFFDVRQNPGKKPG